MLVVSSSLPLFLLAVQVASLFIVAPVSAATREAQLRSGSFDKWLTYHQKVYSSTEQYKLRRSIWLDNQQHVEGHNRAFQAGYTLYAKTVHGPFSDLTDDEFAQQYLMESQDCSATHTSSGRLRSSVDCPDNCNKHPSVDWRTKGIMTPVKNQGNCGSCWTFSTSGCLEAHTCLQARKDCTHWKGLAEEQLVECAGAFNNNGCYGGLPSQAFEYIKYSGGMATENDYPYNAPEINGTGICHVPRKGWKARVAEVYNITTLDEEDLQHAVAQVGPVSVAYQVFSDFRLYSHGIYDSYNHTTNKTMCHSGSHDVNHAVVAVGLGTSSKTGVDYYIIRNSWSADWGMEGHFG